MKSINSNNSRDVFFAQIKNEICSVSERTDVPGRPQLRTQLEVASTRIHIIRLLINLIRHSGKGALGHFSCI